MHNEKSKTEEARKGRAWLALVVAFPLTTVVLSSIMIYLAYSRPDTRVDDHWRKEGLGIIKDGDATKRANLLGIQAQLSFDLNDSAMRAFIVHPGQAPNMLSLTLSHATIADKDQSISLSKLDNQAQEQLSYEGHIEGSLAGKYYITLSHPEGTWSLAETVHFSEKQAPVLIEFK